MAATDNEHFDTLWDEWIRLTGNGARKKDALRFFMAKARQAKKDHELFSNEIILALSRLDKHRAELKQKNEFVPPWPALAVYINQERYDDTITIKKEGEVSAIAHYCDNHPSVLAHHNFPPFLCTSCLAKQHEKNSETTELRRQYWRDNDLSNKTGAECRDMCLELIRSKWG